MGAGQQLRYWLIGFLAAGLVLDPLRGVLVRSASKGYFASSRYGRASGRGQDGPEAGA